MSSKLSSQSTGGRRTPLTLGPSTGQKPHQKPNAEPNPPDSTPIDLKNRKSDDKSPNLGKTDSPAKNPSAKDTTNTETKKEKTSKKDSINSQENGHGENKDEKLSSNKEESLKKLDKKISRESPRNKDALKIDVKENNKETDKTKPIHSTRSKSPDKDKDKRLTPIEKKESQKKPQEEVQKEKNVKSDDETKKVEANKKKDLDKEKNVKNEDETKKPEANKKKDQEDLKKTPIEELLHPKRISRAATQAQYTAKQEPLTAGSLQASLQSEFRDFDESIENDVEMESLLLDVDVSESATTIPTAAKTSIHSPSLRSSSRKSTYDDINEKKPTLNPIRSVRKETARFTPLKSLPAVEVPVTSTPDGKTFYSLPPTSYRQISGRRSLRPLPEYKLQHSMNYRESYRLINTDLDYTNNTSMNVTVGSESPPQSESFISSFFSFGRGKKRALTPPPTISTADEIQDDAVNTNTASPKRPRLDLSGLIGLVTSPVTMLKNRLYRGKIDSSTPNNKTEEVDDVDVDADEEGENVSEIISEEKKILLKEEKEKNDNNGDDDEDDDGDEEDDTTGELDDEEESNDSIEKEKSVEHLRKIEIGDEVIATSNDAEEVVNLNRRGRCSLM